MRPTGTGALMVAVVAACGGEIGGVAPADAAPPPFDAGPCQEDPCTADFVVALRAGLACFTHSSCDDCGTPGDDGACRWPDGSALDPPGAADRALDADVLGAGGARCYGYRTLGADAVYLFPSGTYTVENNGSFHVVVHCPDGRVSPDNDVGTLGSCLPPGTGTCCGSACLLCGPGGLCGGV